MSGQKLKSRENQSLFALKPGRLARVTEISEATAAAPIGASQRVNFHIGNPIEDPALTQRYQQLVLGLPLMAPGQAIESQIAALNLDPAQESQTRFIAEVAARSSPYTPIGGFSQRSPGELAPRIEAWLNEGQQESLNYDLGLKGGHREVTLVSGGVQEALRLLLLTLQRSLIRRPAALLYHQTCPLPSPSSDRGLRTHQLPGETDAALAELAKRLQSQPQAPHFIVLGSILPEAARRSLRRLCLDAPLYIVEANQAPNHLSLAREAGMADKVLRILSLGALESLAAGSSVAFIAGEAEYIRALERTHFELKGTPSYPEMAFAAYLLKHGAEEASEMGRAQPPEQLSLGSAAGGEAIAPRSPDQLQRMTSPSPSALAASDRLGRSAAAFAERLEHTAQQILERSANLAQHQAQRARDFGPLRRMPEDPLVSLASTEVIEQFFLQHSNPEWQQTLEEALLAAFISQHPEYDPRDCSIISGSTRTALGILGQHCGITEVVIPDFSWTYHHVFDRVTTVPLTDNLDLDVDAIIDCVAEKLAQDRSWGRRAAVALNNPHNASGSIFRTSEVARLVAWLLEHEVWVIDDLSYKGLGPEPFPADYASVRQIVSAMLVEGKLSRRQASKLISVHAFSKTDCCAGARLAIAEIPDPNLQAGFRSLLRGIQPNLTAILISYLFYRRRPDEVALFWSLRNQKLGERLAAIKTAIAEIPPDRNPFGVRVEGPRGSMYPRLVVEHLPAGVSMDWLAAGLAGRGIGLLPFGIFARTAEGFDLAHKSFRITLGGSDDPPTLQSKTRRMLIDLNRTIDDQAGSYSLRTIRRAARPIGAGSFSRRAGEGWQELEPRLRLQAERQVHRLLLGLGARVDTQLEEEFFHTDYLPERLNLIRQRLEERARIADAIVQQARSDAGDSLLAQLSIETQPISLSEKHTVFRQRLYDRTVHPTQMYALEAELAGERLVQQLLFTEGGIERSGLRLARQLAAEFIGTNIAISSDQEAQELVLDLASMVDCEHWAALGYDVEFPSMLSFWGDWDGSSRPSGQGHRLVAGALLENVTSLARLVARLETAQPGIRIAPELSQQIRRLEVEKTRFWSLLNEITDLTSRFEERYLRVLPFHVQPGLLRRIGMRLNLARDPIARLWEHNDRLERRMLGLRERRQESMEGYFQLNAALQRTLRDNLDALRPLLRDADLAARSGLYFNTLRRFALTPRIHQNLIEASDQFAIDTTVHNLVEINRMGGQQAAPGLVLAIQISMSSDAGALIALDRKLRQQREQVLRSASSTEIPEIAIVPLFEHTAAIAQLPEYLGEVWEYAMQSHRLGQEPKERFSEIIGELFFAGSDLSQQVGQPAGAAIYREARYQTARWLAEHDLTGQVRVKYGCGEAPQRQGGYYDRDARRAPVITSSASQQRLALRLGDAERRAWEVARMPLRGVELGGEFRTFQSNISEQLRFLPVDERLRLLYHIRQSQRHHEDEVAHAASALRKTRLRFHEHGMQRLEMLTRGQLNSDHHEFLALAQKHFQQILYGREEDLVGIHLISHFVARTIPPLRDRPVVRPTREIANGDGQEILGRYARTLPLARHGSMLRAIAHNQAQTMVLGVNQMTTGLFRALEEFSQLRPSGSDRVRALEDQILPNLSVYDMLHTLRLYHDPQLKHLSVLETAFPAGNSAFVALHEDNDLITRFVPLLQQELLRRSGMHVKGAYTGGGLQPELLPCLKPELAVLLQPDLFNLDLEHMLELCGGEVEPGWRQAVGDLLMRTANIRRWREQIWQIIHLPISSQVESFLGLAQAIHTLTAGGTRPAATLVADPSQVQRLGTQVAGMLRGSADDPLRQFLVASVQYLMELPRTLAEIPVDALRALRDVERIVTIEEQALQEVEQSQVRFALLKIARAAGENG